MRIWNNRWPRKVGYFCLRKKVWLEDANGAFVFINTLVSLEMMYRKQLVIHCRLAKSVGTKLFSRFMTQSYWWIFLRLTLIYLEVGYNLHSLFGEQELIVGSVDSQCDPVDDIE